MKTLLGLKVFYGKVLLTYISMYGKTKQEAYAKANRYDDVFGRKKFKIEEVYALNAREHTPTECA